MENSEDFNVWKQELGPGPVVRAVAGAVWDAFGPLLIVAGLAGVVLLLARFDGARGVAAEAGAAVPVPVRVPFGFQAG
jgi:hypothetical protein